MAVQMQPILTSDRRKIPVEVKTCKSFQNMHPAKFNRYLNQVAAYQLGCPVEERRAVLVLIERPTNHFCVIVVNPSNTRRACEEWAEFYKNKTIKALLPNIRQ